jgi:hypothetical protein
VNDFIEGVQALMGHWFPVFLMSLIWAAIVVAVVYETFFRKGNK